MISFNCSCGKKYQLPDRIAGREVRCNQCEKTLIVPKQSQDAPVVPFNDQQAVEEKQAEQLVVPAPDKPPVIVKESIPEPKPERQPKKASDSPGSKLPDDDGKAEQTTEVPKTPQVRSKRGFLVPALIFVAVLFGLAIGILVGSLSGGAKSTPVASQVVVPSETTETVIEESTVDRETSPVEFKMPEYSLQNWSVRQEEPIPFAVKTADAKPIELSLDGNPVEVHQAEKKEKEKEKEKEDVLSMLDAAFSDAAPKVVVDTQEHKISFRITSESPETLRLIWPERYPAELDGAQIKKFRLSLYLSEKANSAFKPVKPEGFDRVVEFSEISLRLTADTGYVEFVPADKSKLTSIVERARRGWLPLQIPIQGDETWKRTDHGLVGPLIVQRIELLVKPTGNGLTFWIDNLGIEDLPSGRMELPLR